MNERAVDDGFYGRADLSDSYYRAAAGGRGAPRENEHQWGRWWKITERLFIRRCIVAACQATQTQVEPTTPRGVPIGPDDP